MKTLSLLLCLVPAVLSAQGADFQWSKALGSGKRVRVYNINGNVAVSASTSGKIEVTGTRRGSGGRADDVVAEARETSDGVVVCVMHRDSDATCDEHGYHSEGDDHWNGNARMDLDIRLPADESLAASSVSGDVRVTGTQGDLRVKSVSGDVHVEGARAASVSASTVSGDVDVRLAAFTGNGDLTFKSVSGGVTLELPRDLDADVSMHSVSGSLESDYPLTLNGRASRRRIEARIGKGGRAIDVTTVSGDVRLRMAK